MAGLTSRGAGAVPVNFATAGGEHMTTRKIRRSADTGQFVTPSEVKKHPKTTVTETVKMPTKKK